MTVKTLLGRLLGGARTLQDEVTVRILLRNEHLDVVMFQEVPIAEVRSQGPVADGRVVICLEDADVNRAPRQEVLR